jgi:predicted phosphodiesterase
MKSSLVLIFTGLLGINFSLSQTNWRFAVVGDTHVGSSDTIAEMIPYMLNDSLDFVVVAGDLVEGGLATPGTQLSLELEEWKTIFSPIYNAGIPVFGIRGNHEDDANNDINVWNNSFSGSYAFPQNGPIGETNLTYSFTHKNAKMILLDEYKNIHQVNQNWLDQELNNNSSRHVFVFGHEAAFKVFHADCLDDSVTARNTFWNSMKSAGVKVYFCGHDHFLDAALVDDGDGNTQNDIYQYLVGTGGGWLMSQYSNYNGDNGPFSLNRVFHEMEYGYSIVEINGDSYTDCDVTIRWKKRITNPIDMMNEYVISDNVIQYSVCNMVEIQEEKEEKVMIYPNPTKQELFFEGYKFGTIIFSNTLGKIIQEIEPVNNAIDVSNLLDGVYFIKLNDVTLRFVKN